MAGPHRKLSKASKRVLGALYEEAPSTVYGAQLMDIAKAPSGTLYPILMRFHEYRWVTVTTETGDPRVLGRPLRKHYQLTGLGVQAANQLIDSPTLGSAVAMRQGSS